MFLNSSLKVGRQTKQPQKCRTSEALTLSWCSLKNWLCSICLNQFWPCSSRKLESDAIISVRVTRPNQNYFDYFAHTETECKISHASGLLLSRVWLHATCVLPSGSACTQQPSWSLWAQARDTFVVEGLGSSFQDINCRRIWGATA